MKKDNSIKTRLKNCSKHNNNKTTSLTKVVTVTNKIKMIVTVLKQDYYKYNEAKKTCKFLKTNYVVDQAIQLSLKGDEKGIIFKESNENIHNENILDTNTLNETVYHFQLMFHKLLVELLCMYGWIYHGVNRKLLEFL